MFSRRRGRFLAAVTMTAAVIVSVLPASPAAAAAADVEAIGTGNLPGRIVRASCRVTGALIGLNTLQLVVEADATATPDGLLTEVSCSASSSAGGSVQAVPVACPGPACASAGTGQVRLGLITVCVTATGHFGPLFPESKTVSHCATGAGAKVDQNLINVT